MLIVLRFPLAGNPRWAFFSCLNADEQESIPYKADLACLNFSLLALKKCFKNTFPDDVAFLLQSHGPRAFKENNIITLSTECLGDQIRMAYQAAHEICHLCIPSGVQPELKFWEETICQIAATYVLIEIYKDPQMKPILSEQVINYIPTYISQISCFPSSCSPYEFLLHEFEYLKQTPNDYEKNQILANDLFPLVYQTLDLWEWASMLAEYHHLNTLESQLNSLVTFINIERPQSSIIQNFLMSEGFPKGPSYG